MRAYRHPQINHAFYIKDIDINTIEIGGLVLHKKDLDDILIASNYENLYHSIIDLELPILQHILAYKNKK